MENKSKIEKLFRDAQKNQYKGNFNDFVATYFPTEKHFVNDTGKQEAVRTESNNQNPAENMHAEQGRQPIQRPMYAEAPADNQNIYRQDTGKVSSVSSSKADDDDKIFGMNKFLFAGLAVLLLLGVGFGAYVYFGKTKTNKLGDGGNAGSAATGPAGPPAQGVV